MYIHNKVNDSVSYQTGADKIIRVIRILFFPIIISTLPNHSEFEFTTKAYHETLLKHEWMPLTFHCASAVPVIMTFLSSSGGVGPFLSPFISPFFPECICGFSIYNCSGMQSLYVQCDIIIKSSSTSNVTCIVKSFHF